MDWREIWGKYKLLIGTGLFGLILTGSGVLLLVSSQEQPTIEILPAENSLGNQATIFVDLEGAVEKPGVYELPADSRLNDLLIRSGGLSALADRSWVTQNLNLAQTLADSTKIYIPAKGEERQVSTGQVAGAFTKININMASPQELESLWGIGSARAGEIAANRPYQKVEELRDRKIVPKNVYEKIKDKITAN